MDFKILDVFTQDGQLVVKVEHYHPDGSVFFVENYTWQGREGLKQQRRVNALGEPLLNDGTVAPKKVVRRGPPDELDWYVPAGRQWGYNNRPRMSEASVLRVIQETHRQRLATGWPQGKVDILGSFKASAQDEAGAVTLLPFFNGLIGQVR